MSNHLTAEEWFSELIKAGENDPVSLTDELLLDVTEQIYVCMTRLGVDRAELAQRLGVSPAQVSRLLGGKPNMTIRTLVGMANALGQRVHVELRPKEEHGATTGAASSNEIAPAPSSSP